ncbi:MAG: radical SAM family heme chaperone HemW [Lachnospiraceae bacterium]|nr:radical SAM family heme chaperone HemW [Lachnospiraceae bacterium]
MERELELYIHIPFCVRKCNYCDFVSFAGKEDAYESYVQALCNEIAMYKSVYKDCKIRSIYIGGGTPTVLSEEQMERIVKSLEDSFTITGTKHKRKNVFSKKILRPTTEFSMECNPGAVTKEKLKAFKDLGINRMSFGLQSINANELKMLGRIHTYEDFVKSFEDAREAGFDNINVDLMQALPGQTLASWELTLSQVAMWHPEHISAYSLIIEEGTNFSKWLKKGKTLAGEEQSGIKMPDGQLGLLPTEGEEREIYYFTKDFLEKSKYKRYEISNYAIEGFDCVHNLGYWQRKNYLGLGLNASSMVDNTRWKNTADLNKYMDTFLHLDELQQTEGGETLGNLLITKGILEDYHKLSRKEQMEEHMFLGLRQTEGISMTEFIDIFHQDMITVYGEALDKLYAEGLVELAEDNIRLTDKGVDVSNVVLSEFLLD